VNRYVDNFDGDLIFGHVGEQIIANRIKNKYPNTQLVTGKVKTHDLFIETHYGEVTVEVKNDRTPHKNIFIETFNTNNSLKKPSGINVTTADWWAYINNNEIFWFKTYKIKDCIKNEKNSIRLIEGMPKETGLVDAFVIKPEIFIKYLDKKVKLNMEEIKLIEAGKDKCQ
jgi:hypothetical protein